MMVVDANSKCFIYNILKHKKIRRPSNTITQLTPDSTSSITYETHTIIILDLHGEYKPES